MRILIQLTAVLNVALFVAAVAGCASTPAAELSAATQYTPSAEIPATQASPPVSGRQATVPIYGMACPFCTYNIQRQLQALEGVQRVDVSLEKGKASVTLSKQGKPTAEQLREAIESAGFTPGEIQMP